MKCVLQDLEWRLHPMVHCVGWIYGSFHHSPHKFTCYLYLPCARYDEFLEIPTQNVLAYHMRWWQYLVSFCFLSSGLALGLLLGIQIYYNLNWTKNIAIRASEDHEAASFFANALLLFGYTFIRFFHSMSGRRLGVVTLIPKAWRMSWGLGSASEMCCVIHTWLDKN